MVLGPVWQLHQQPAEQPAWSRFGDSAHPPGRLLAGGCLLQPDVLPRVRLPVQRAELLRVQDGSGDGAIGRATNKGSHPLTMPAPLLKAHQQLDRAVDRCYRPEPFPSDRHRVEYLFALYEQLSALLVTAAEPARKARRMQTAS